MGAYAEGRLALVADFDSAFCNFAWLSAFRCASMVGCSERPSMLFACGSDESEEARLGRETRCEGGILLVELEVRLEDAEELDFCVWDGMGRG